MAKIFKENELRNEEKISQILLEKEQGATITELTELSQIPRSAVRISLARLEGANKVTLRKIGMAKVYILNRKFSNQHTQIESINKILAGDSNE